MECLYFQHCILDHYSYQIWKSTPRVPSDIQKYPKENIHLGALLHKLPSTIWIHLTSWKYFYVSIRNYMVTKSQVQWVTKISEFFSVKLEHVFKIIFDVFFQGPRNPCRIAIFVRLLFGWTTLRFFWAVEKATYHALHMWRCYFGTFSTLYEPHLWTVFSGIISYSNFTQKSKTVALTQCGNYRIFLLRIFYVKSKLANL